MVLDADKSIKDFLEDGSEVVVECSSMRHLLHKNHMSAAILYIEKWLRYTKFALIFVEGPQSFVSNSGTRSFNSVHDESKLESIISGIDTVKHHVLDECLAA